MLKPLPTKLLLIPTPKQSVSPGGLHLPQGSNDAGYDSWAWTIFACGSQVSFDFKPGARVVIDPGLPHQHNFEYQGLSFKTIDAKHVQLLLEQ